MKLLNKSDVNNLKAVETKRSIDEGLRIAKRVDVLREVRADEEASLNEFRIRTLEQINQEINEEVSKRDALKEEVKLLETKRRETLEPLIEREEEIEEVEARLQDFSKSLEVRAAELSSKENALTNRENVLLPREEILRTRDEETTQRLNLVLEDQKRLELAEGENNSIRMTLSQEQTQFTRFREEEKTRLDEREKSLKESELQVVKDRREIGQERKQLADERLSIERIKHG